ncbi:MAG: class I SAM-dependent methyltransferase [Cyanobacteria bacterium P01_F01_bin.53]
MKESHQRVQWVYDATSNQELETRYDQWADKYDEDLTEEFVWKSPKAAATVLTKYIQPTARILDAGTGTGLVGKCLAEAGYQNLVAMDMSLGMLKVAQEKQLYRTYHRMVLGDTLDFKTDEFDATISVGVFTQGHAPARSLDEIVRVTKPGGLVVFSLRVETYENDGFKEKQSELEQSGKWKVAETSEKFQPMPQGEPEVWHQIWAYQVA